MVNGVQLGREQAPGEPARRCLGSCALWMALSCVCPPLPREAGLETKEGPGTVAGSPRPEKRLCGVLFCFVVGGGGPVVNHRHWARQTVSGHASSVRRPFSRVGDRHACAAQLVNVGGRSPRPGQGTGLA